MWGRGLEKRGFGLGGGWESEESSWFMFGLGAGFLLKWIMLEWEIKLK